MKKAILISMIFSTFLSCDISVEKNYDQLLINGIERLSFLQEKISLENSPESSIYNALELKEITFLHTVQTVLTFIILIFAFFIIILTPLILLYCWFNNYIDYQKDHSIFYTLDSKFDKLPKHFLFEYKRTYSNMLGNGLGIFAWIFSSFFYISKNYDQISIGLLDYFRFPFKLFAGLTTQGTSLQEAIPFRIWISMILIVGISITHFYIGRYIGRLIINTNYRKPFFSKNKSQKIITN